METTAFFADDMARYLCLITEQSIHPYELGRYGFEVARPTPGKYRLWWDSSATPFLDAFADPGLSTLHDSALEVLDAWDERPPDETAEQLAPYAHAAVQRLLDILEQIKARD